MLKFESDAGDVFYYRGRDKNLLKLTEAEYEPYCRFVSGFEKAYLDANSPPVSMALNPRRIVVEPIDPRRSGAP